MLDVFFLKFKEELESYNKADVFLDSLTVYYSTYKPQKTVNEVLLENFLPKMNSDY